MLLGQFKQALDVGEGVEVLQGGHHRLDLPRRKLQINWAIPGRVGDKQGDEIWHSKHWSELGVICDHPFPYSVFLRCALGRAHRPMLVMSW